MKFRLLLIITFCFSMIALETSCTRTSENKVVGKWKMTEWQWRQASFQDWIERLDDDYVFEFRDDNTMLLYYEGMPSIPVGWTYDPPEEIDDIPIIHVPALRAFLELCFNSYKVTTLSSNEMIWWNYEYTIDGFNINEERITFKRIR